MMLYEMTLRQYNLTEEEMLAFIIHTKLEIYVSSENKC